MSIVFSGGGTLGSITSLLSVAASVRALDDKIRFYFTVPKGSPGKELVLREGIPWYEFPGGKLRRYVSVKNFVEPLNVARAFFISRKYFKLWRVRVFISSGSFVSPPLAWQAHLLGAKVAVIQLDILPGLANRLMLPIADVHFVAWDVLTTRYPRAIVSGLPLPSRRSFSASDTGSHLFSSDKRPMLLIVGGGTGAEKLNRLVETSRSELTSFCNVIHITGRSKGESRREAMYVSIPYLSQIDFLPLIAKATLVVSRAGMGALSDAIAFRKPLMLIPIRKSHQEHNASFVEKHGAAHVLSEVGLDSQLFVRSVKMIIEDKKELLRMREAIGTLSSGDASALIARRILSLYHEHS